MCASYPIGHDTHSPVTESRYVAPVHNASLHCDALDALVIPVVWPIGHGLRDTVEPYETVVVTAQKPSPTSSHDDAFAIGKYVPPSQ